MKYWSARHVSLLRISDNEAGGKWVNIFILVCMGTQIALGKALRALKKISPGRERSKKKSVLHDLAFKYKSEKVGIMKVHIEEPHINIFS